MVHRRTNFEVRMPFCSVYMIHFLSPCWPWPFFWPWNRCAILPVGWVTVLPCPTNFWGFAFSTYGPTPVRRTMWHRDLDLWPWRSWRVLVIIYRSSYSIYIPSLKFLGLSLRKIWCTSDLGIIVDVVLVFLRLFVLDLLANTYQSRHVTLRPWPFPWRSLRLPVMGLRAPSMYRVWSS